MIKVFLDTEFTSLNQHASLISIGLIAESGEVFYAEFNDYPLSEISPWLAEHVISKLSGDLPAYPVDTNTSTVLVQGNRFEIALTLNKWFERFGGKNSVQVWADVLAWDWVLFCELFGGAFGIPEQLHYIPCDLSTMLWAKGLDPDADREELAGDFEWSAPHLNLGRHHALFDALLEKVIFSKLS